MSHSFSGRGRSSRSSRAFSQRSTIDRSRYIKTAVSPIETAAFVPQRTFTEFGLDARLVENIQRHNYDAPTPIQDEVIPMLMQGKDVVGIANTGTGKTAAFLLPFIDKVLKDTQQGVLILAPTRELALQIMDEFKIFAQNLPIGVTLCIGGMNLNNQIQRLRDNPHFVIGTPGRIKDLVQRHAFRPSMFTNIVLDEVDRMLDIGFRKDILELIAQLPVERHAALLSATLDGATKEIIDQFLSDPVTVSVKKQETADLVHQDVVRIKPDQNKVDVLSELLRQSEFEKVIVFGRTKHGINKLEKQLFSRGIQVTSIHGNKTQNARQFSLRLFKQGKVQALLATDVAARGIDIEGVTHVINYDEPATYDDYIHRIGRTGRAGKMGQALTFIS